MATTTLFASSPLEQADERLRRSAGTAESCFDDLAAPDWDAYRRGRADAVSRTRRPDGAAAGVPDDSVDDG